MKRKTLFMKGIVTAILLLTLTGQCFAEIAPFTDISSAEGKDKIVSLQQQGIIKGPGSGLFAPDSPLTAAQGTQLFVNAFNLNLDTIRFIKEPKASDYFKNAKDNAWYSDALIIITFSGLELPSDMRPESQWTREEFTGYLVSLMEKQGNLPMIKLVPADIADNSQLDAAYSGAVQRALHYGLVSLDQKGNFRPKDSVTRGEAAVQIFNALEYLKSHPVPIQQQ